MARDSYACRDPCSRIQHTLDGQKAVAHEVKPVANPSCAGKRGAHENGVRR